MHFYYLSGTGPRRNCRTPANRQRLGRTPAAGTPPARVYDAVGVWFAEKGDLNCAVAAFKQALRLEPRLAEAHFDLGLVRQSQQQLAAAISEFRLALQYDPALLQAHCALGSSLGDPTEAEAEFRKALAVNPQLVCALDGIAQVLVKERRYDAAIDYWRQALRIQPDAPDLQLALATATYKAAKAREADGLTAMDGAGVADAIRLLTDLLKSHPDMTAAYFTLGNIYANERRNREAADRIPGGDPPESHRYGRAGCAGQGAHRRISIYRGACARPQLRGPETERSLGARHAWHGVPANGRLRQGRAGT